MVLDSGNLVGVLVFYRFTKCFYKLAMLPQAEYDTPRKLLENDGGLFRSLVDQSGDKEQLYAMAL